MPKWALGILLFGTLSLAGVTGVSAGPALLPEAQPEFQDPLSRIRPDLPAEADTGPAAAGLTGGQTFTIVGAPEAGSLEGPEKDELTQTVREEFLGQAGATTQAPENQASSVQGVDDSASNLIRALVNTVPGEGGNGGNGGRSGRQQDESGILSSVIDATMVDLITTMLNPKLTTDGMVTFSIAGFGDFALLLLQESGGFFIVDLNSGVAMKFSDGIRLSDNDRISETRRGVTSGNRGSSNALQRLLDILERNVVPIVTSPITLATIVLFSMIWIIWRLSARE